MLLGFLGGAMEGQEGTDGQQEFLDVVPVGRRDDVDRIEAQAVKGSVGGAPLHAIDLVDHQDGGLAQGADPGGDLSVHGVPAIMGIHHEQYHMRLLHGRLG